MTAATRAKGDSRNTSIRRVPRVSMTSGAVDGDLAVMSSEDSDPVLVAERSPRARRRSAEPDGDVDLSDSRLGALARVGPERLHRERHVSGAKRRPG